MILSERVRWVKEDKYCGSREDKSIWAAEDCDCAGCKFLRRQEERVEFWTGFLEKQEAWVKEKTREYTRQNGETVGRGFENFAIHKNKMLMQDLKQELEDIYVDEWLQEREWDRRDRELQERFQQLMIELRLSESYEQERVRSDEEMEFSGDGMHVAELTEEQNIFYLDASEVEGPGASDSNSNSNDSSTSNNSSGSNSNSSESSNSNSNNSRSHSSSSSSSSSSNNNSINIDRDVSPARIPLNQQTVTGWASFPFDRGRWFNSGGSERRPRRYGKDIPFDRGKMEQRMDGDWSQRVQELEYSTTPMCCA